MSWILTGTMAVLSAGSTALSIKAQNEAIAQQQESINATTMMNYSLKKQQEEEVKQKAAVELTGEQIKRVQERGAIKAAQGESGVAGASPLRELANSYLQQSLTAGSIISKEEAEQRSIGLEMQSTYLQSLSEYNKLESQATEGWEAGLQILQSGIQGGLSGYSMGGALGASSATAGAGGIAGAGSLSGGQLISKTTGESMFLTPDAAGAIRGGEGLTGDWYFKNVTGVTPGANQDALWGLINGDKINSDWFSKNFQNMFKVF